MFVSDGGLAGSAQQSNHHFRQSKSFNGIKNISEAQSRVNNGASLIGGLNQGKTPKKAQAYIFAKPIFVAGVAKAGQKAQGVDLDIMKIKIDKMKNERKINGLERQIQKTEWIQKQVAMRQVRIQERKDWLVDFKKQPIKGM